MKDDRNADRELRQGLRAYAATLAQTHTPPLASHVWLRANQRRKQADLRRAEQPLRIMQTVAIVCILILAAWLTVHSSTHTTLPAAGTPLLLAACATIAASIAACWTMLHTSRRTS